MDVDQIRRDLRSRLYGKYGVVEPGYDVLENMAADVVSRHGTIEVRLRDVCQEYVEAAWCALENQSVGGVMYFGKDEAQSLVSNVVKSSARTPCGIPPGNVGKIVFALPEGDHWLIGVEWCIQPNTEAHRHEAELINRSAFDECLQLLEGAEPHSGF